MEKFDTNTMIELGALAKPLSEQLSTFNVDKEELERLDMDADAISRLYIRDLITESQATKARQKLMKRIHRLVKANNM